MTEPTKPVPPRRDGFNFFACFLDAIGFPLGISLFSSVTILPLFIKELTDRAVFVGLIAAISSSGFFLPQLIAASWIERLPIKRYYVLVLALVERLAILALVPITLLFGTQAPRVLLIWFFILFTVHNFSMGFNGPAYFDLVAKVIPVNKRGKMYGIAGGIGGLLSLLGAWLAKFFLQDFNFPFNFSLCFLSGFIVLTLTVVPLGFIDEPPSTTSSRQSWLKYFRRVGRVFWVDVNFRRFVASQIFVSVFEAVLAFFTAYALDEMAATKGNVATFTACFMAGRMIGEPFWGYVADQRGNRPVLLINIGLAGVACILATTAQGLGLFYIVFVLAALGQSGINIQSSNMTMEFASPESLPTYTALRASITAPFRAILPLIAGMAVGHVGYRTVFVLTVLLLVAGWGLMWGVKDPRHNITQYSR